MREFFAGDQDLQDTCEMMWFLLPWRLEPISVYARL
jgi:hypothetical protein